MDTITIPKKITEKGELVVIPRKEYKKLLDLAKKRIYTKLDKDLDQAIAEYKAGNFFGPFKTVKEGIKFLESRRITKTKK